jgi:predicted PurR-regulated permease PerM
MTGPLPGPVTGLGPRERRWLVIFLALGSAYIGFLLAERLLGVLAGFGTVVIILFLSWLLAFVVSPLVSWLEGRLALGRPAAVIATYAVGLIVIGFLLFYTASAITQQVADLARNYPETEAGIIATLGDWERSLEFGRGRIDLTDIYASAVGEVERLGGEVVEQAQNIAGVTIATLGSLLLIIVLSLYMLIDSRRILARLRALVPRRYSDETELLERSIVRAFGGFLRAQLILAAMQAVLVAVVGIAFGIPYLFLWGTMSALAMLIPFFGPPLALLPPIVGAALFTGGAVVPVAVILVVVQTVLVNWLQPRLMRGALGLHPILVLVGLLLGAQVAGVWGALFGIPVIAVIWVFVSYLVFRTVPNAALPEKQKLPDIDPHVMVAVSREQVGDETHPHIHVTRRRRPDGTEQVELSMGEPPPGTASDRGDAPA